MARLQDFSDVTPSSSSDKLLIVQSAGQGLATLDTAGQQIANNTSVSQLHTTSKTLAGAINEHDSEIGDLSTLTTTDKSSLVGAVNEVNRIDTKTITISITCRGYIRCYQLGKMVFVDININTDGNTTPVNTTIATGFPKPYESFYPRLLARDNNGSYAQVLNFDKNNGTIKTADTVMQGNTWWGCQFTYFTND